MSIEQLNRILEDELSFIRNGNPPNKNIEKHIQWLIKPPSNVWRPKLKNIICYETIYSSDEDPYPFNYPIRVIVKIKYKTDIYGYTTAFPYEHCFYPEEDVQTTYIKLKIELDENFGSCDGWTIMEGPNINCMCMSDLFFSEIWKEAHLVLRYELNNDSKRLCFGERGNDILLKKSS